MTATDWIEIDKEGMPEEHENSVYGRTYRESDYVLVRLSNGTIFVDMTINGHWVMVRKYYGSEHNLKVTHYQKIVPPVI